MTCRIRSVIRSNESIKQDYIVNITENKAAPDVLLKTTNNSIKSSVYLQGNVPRAAEVTIETTNSGIATAFPDKDEGQAVTFNVRTTNSEKGLVSSIARPLIQILFPPGKIEVAFPPNFNGIVTAKTSNAKVNLSDSLRENSMLVPNAPEAPSGLVTYRIKPKAANNSVGDSKGSADGADIDQAMLDVCHIQTSNSSINLGYLNDVSKGLGGVSGKKDSGCVVS